MKKQTKQFLHPLKCWLIVVSVLTSFSALSFADACPAINCDCSSLPVDSWQRVCSSYESKIKNACVKNGGKPAHYCSLHGPSARPLPVALTLTDVSVLPADVIEDVHGKTDAMFWSIETDLQTAKDLMEKEQYAQAQGSLKIIERNIDTLFNTQRQVTLSFDVSGNESASAKAWKVYSEKTLKEAEELSSVGNYLWNQRNKGDAKHKKAYSVLSLKVLRIGSKTYEMAAYAYSGARKDDMAAKVWRDASDLSRQIMEYKQEQNAQTAYIDYYRNQAAMRLHRASYHWILDKREKDAKNSLQASLQYMDDKRQLDGLFNNSGDNSEEEAVANSPF